MFTLVYSFKSVVNGKNVMPYLSVGKKKKSHYIKFCFFIAGFKFHILIKTKTKPKSLVALRIIFKLNLLSLYLTF